MSRIRERISAMPQYRWYAVGVLTANTTHTAGLTTIYASKSSCYLNAFQLNVIPSYAPSSDTCIGDAESRRPGFEMCGQLCHYG